MPQNVVTLDANSDPVLILPGRVEGIATTFGIRESVIGLSLSAFVWTRVQRRLPRFRTEMPGWFFSPGGAAKPEPQNMDRANFFGNNVTEERGVL